MPAPKSDPDRYSRTNKWLAQMTETAAAFREYCETEHEREWDRFAHHRALLKAMVDEPRMPDSFSEAIAEQLLMYEEASSKMVALLLQDA